MIKKILMWSIYAGVVGLLIFGAVTRTRAKAGDSAQSAVQIDGGESQKPGQPIEGLGRSGVKGSDFLNADEVHLAEDQEHDWISMTGIVETLDAKSLWIKIGEGDNLEISRRAWRFIQESGLVLTVGDQLQIDGFYENDEFEVSNLVNLTSGNSLQIREDSGRPLWGGGNY